MQGVWAHNPSVSSEPLADYSTDYTERRRANNSVVSCSSLRFPRGPGPEHLWYARAAGLAAFALYATVVRSPAPVPRHVC